MTEATWQQQQQQHPYVCSSAGKKILPFMHETSVQFLGQEDLLEKG